MGWKSILIKPYAKYISTKIQRMASNAIVDQKNVFDTLINKAAATAFGQDHGFEQIKTYVDFANRVPIRDYEGLKAYFERVKDGEKDVLWPGKPLYLAKTSGTTSGVKYIPLTKDSLPNHFGTARNALFHYVTLSGNGQWLDGKMIFLSGSPDLAYENGIHIGRLSGIVNHQVPAWLRTNQLPSYPTNCIEDWETKLDAIIEETLGQDMRLISGIPPWVQMYFERLLAKTGKRNILEIFPNFSIFVFGGVNYEPYRQTMEALIGKAIPSLETYPASEGFIAFQDTFPNEGLLLNTNSGIFFEFVPADKIFEPNPPRLTLEQVERNTNYAIIINNNAGLWGYNIGDTVEFVSLRPFRIRVTGRIKHFISAFGEHVIGKEVEMAMHKTVQAIPAKVTEFTVAPNINPTDGSQAHHQWLIEFEEAPTDIRAFEKKLDEEMVKQNIYYADLITGSILDNLKIKPLSKGAFIQYMKTQGKLGGQNKVPRLSNDRKIADALLMS